MPHLFISYSRADLTFVERLAADLKSAGLDVWYDVSNLGGGSRWNKAIEQAIRDSEHVIVILSPDSIASQWVDDEVSFARTLKKKIVPLYYRPCDLGLMYVNLNWIDIQGEKYKQNFEEVLEALNIAEIRARAAEALAKQQAEEHARVVRQQAEEHARKELEERFLQEAREKVRREMEERLRIEAEERARNEYEVQQVKAKTEKKPLEILKERVPVQVTPPDKLTLSNGMELLRVPVGKFLMGEGEQQHTVNIPYDYWMAHYPVTNAQYNQFTKEDFDKGQENHPVVGVTWHDATAYCKWLNKQIQNSERFARSMNLEIRLPSEAEWEKAARGTDGRKYPWGNDFDKNRCNSYESGKRATTPVGLYSPQGDSIYGCADMSGNMWEWCHSLYKPYPYRENDGREDEKAEGFRGLRGGSWYSDVDGTRVSIRDFLHPRHRDFIIGFRLVLAPPIANIISGKSQG